MKSRLLAQWFGVVAALVCLCTVQVSQGALIVGYSGVPTPVVSTAAGTTNAGITRSSGVTAAGGSSYATKDWTTWITGGTSPNLGDYIQFGWTASPTFGFDLDNLEIQYRRTGSGPKDLQIRMSQNNFSSFTTILTTSTVVANSNVFQDINLTAYNNVTSALFRIYGYNANNGSGQLDLTNFVTTPAAFAVRVNGVAATPEPTSFAVFGLGALAAGYAGWRRRKATPAQDA